MKNNNFSKKLLVGLLAANLVTLPLCGMQNVYNFYERSKDTVNKYVCTPMKNNPGTSTLLLIAGVGVGGYLWYQNKQFQMLMEQRSKLVGAIQVGNAELVSEFLKNQSLVNLIRTEKIDVLAVPWTLLHTTCELIINREKELYAITMELVNAGVSMETIGCDGTPLMLAANKRNTGALHALLVKGANVNAKGSRGLTALHKAVEGYCCSTSEDYKKSNKIIDLLLDYGAEKDAEAKIRFDVNGDFVDLTPAEYAQARAKKYETGKRFSDPDHEVDVFVGVK